jgi:hypothetical protein
MSLNSSDKIAVMIAGVQKAATSSLFDYLKQHPQLQGHDNNELSYFIVDEEYREEIASVWKKYYGPTEKTYFIAKSAGIIFSPTAIERLYDYNPEIKVIIILRNPVDRAYSAFWYARKTGHENLNSFEVAIAADPGRFKNALSKSFCSYLERGYYATQLKNLYAKFPADQVKVVFQEELKNPGQVMRELFIFSNVDADFKVADFSKRNTAATSRFPLITKALKGNKTWKRILKKLFPGNSARRLKANFNSALSREINIPPMNNSTREKLTAHFRDEILELQKMTGRDLKDWL